MLTQSAYARSNFKFTDNGLGKQLLSLIRTSQQMTYIVTTCRLAIVNDYLFIFNSLFMSHYNCSILKQMCREFVNGKVSDNLFALSNYEMSLYFKTYLTCGYFYGLQVG